MSLKERIRNFFPYASGTFHYLFYCVRYPKLFSHRFFLGKHSLIEIGPDARLHFGQHIYFRPNFTGEFYGDVTMGDRVYFNCNCYLAVHQSLRIGNYSIFGEGVSIHDENHIITDGDDPIGERGCVTAPIVIGNNVWVGAKATILPGVHIGDNAVIGANSVVTRDIPAYTVAVGAPARVIRELRPVREMAWR